MTAINGRLVDFFSPTEIAARLIDGLAEPRAFKSLREKTWRTVAKRYDLKRICLLEQLRLLGADRHEKTPPSKERRGLSAA